MATIGNTDLSGGNARTLAAVWRGIRITTTEAGTLGSIFARVTATGTHRCRAFLYATDGSHLASSNIRADLPGSYGAYEEFTGFSYALTDATVYYLILCADSGNTCTIDFDTSGTKPYDGYVGNVTTSINLDTPGTVDPIVDGGARDYAIYGTYTPTAAANKGRLLMLGVG